MYYFGKPACRLDAGEIAWLIGMHVSGRLLDAEAEQKAREEAQGIKRVGLSPAALKRKLAAKKAAQRAAKKKGGDDK